MTLTRLTGSLLAAVFVFFSAPVHANTISFEAYLNGSNETVPNGSPATGFGTVVLDDGAGTITVDLSWSGLSAPATAAHIQGPALPGVNGPVVFPFSGVPAATSGSIPEQSFNITPLEITDLESGLYYFNIHTSNFPGGEIRGQIYEITRTSVPEPSSLLLTGTGLAIVGLAYRQKHVFLK